MRQVTVRRHALSVATALLFIGTSVLAISALSAGTAQGVTAPSMSVQPASAHPGDSVTVSWAHFTPGCGLRIALDGSMLGKGAGPSGSAAVTVPASAKPSAGHLFTVRQSAVVGTKCTAIAAGAPFTVLRPPPSPTTKPPTIKPPTIKPPSTATPPGTTTKPPATIPPGTTTAPTSPGATGPTTSPTGSPTPGPTGPAGLTPRGGAGSPPGSSPTADGGLWLDRLVVVPGDVLTASGQGCPPGATVQLSAGADPAGTATAGLDGAFSAPVRISHVSPGRVIISADCGVLLTSGVDQVVTISSPLAQTRVLLVFVVLIGFLVLRWQVGSAIRPRQ